MKRVAQRRPVVITDADTSQHDQLRSRQIRYATMMGLRVVCLITAAVLVAVQAPMLWLFLPLTIAGMVLLPWMAVLIANDRPPRKEYTLGARLHGRGHEPTKDLPAPRTLPETAPEQRVIDADN